MPAWVTPLTPNSALRLTRLYRNFSIFPSNLQFNLHYLSNLKFLISRIVVGAEDSWFFKNLNCSMIKIISKLYNYFKIVFILYLNAHIYLLIFSSSLFSRTISFFSATSIILLNNTEVHRWLGSFFVSSSLKSVLKHS